MSTPPSPTAPTSTLAALRTDDAVTSGPRLGGCRVVAVRGEGESHVSAPAGATADLPGHGPRGVVAEHDRDAAGSVEARILGRLARRLGGRRYELWIQPSVRLAYDAASATLGVAVPNRFVAEKIRSDFAGELREAAAAELGGGVAGGEGEGAAAVEGPGLRVEVSIQPDRFTPRPAGEAVHPGDAVRAGKAGGAGDGLAFGGVMGGPRAGGLDFGSSRGGVGGSGVAGSPARGRVGGLVRGLGVGGVDPALAAPLRHRLEDFVVGRCNELAYAAALALTPAAEGRPGEGDADDPRAATLDGDAGPVERTPAGGGGLFLHGGCGVGKTHLLQGVCRRKLEQSPEARVLYTTAESFTNAYITAVRNNRLDTFRRQLRRLDLLAIDDVEFFANKDKTQQEFLHCFDHIELAGARVVMASDSHPKLIKRFSEALVSRCVQGLVVQVHAPDVATRRTLVQRLAGRRGLVIQPGLEERVVAHAGASVRELEGVVAQLHALASLDQPQGPTRRIHRALVDKLAASQRELGSTRPVRFEEIQATVCQQFQVDPRQVLGSSRHRMVVLARAILIHLARQTTTLSFPEIAAAMGKSSHSTVVTASQRMAGQLEANDPLLLPGRAEPTTPVQLVEDVRQALLRRVQGR